MTNIRHGFASHPDNTSRHNNANQKQWLAESEKVINEFAARLPDQATKDEPGKFKNFTEAYEFLAEKRRAIAELGYGAIPNEIQRYGVFREGKILCEEFKISQRCWHGMTPKVFELTDKLIAKVEQNSTDAEQKEGPYCFDGAKYSYGKQSGSRGVIEDGFEIGTLSYKRHSITIDSPHSIMVGKTLLAPKASVTIEKWEYKDSRESNPYAPPSEIEDIVFVIYALCNKEVRKDYFALANEYYQNLLNIFRENTNRVQEFFENAGKLAHFLARILPVSLGSAAIAEWMIRGIAYKKAIQLGFFNYASGMSWDFNALFQPNLTEYCRWYSDEAFVHTRLLSPEEAKQGFSFSNTKEQSVALVVGLSSAVTADRESGLYIYCETVAGIAQLKTTMNLSSVPKDDAVNERIKRFHPGESLTIDLRNKLYLLIHLQNDLDQNRKAYKKGGVSLTGWKQPTHVQALEKRLPQLFFINSSNIEPIFAEVNIILLATPKTWSRHFRFSAINNFYKKYRDFFEQMERSFVINQTQMLIVRQ